MTSLVVPPAWLGQPSSQELSALVQSGDRARVDYIELARALDADIIDMQYLAEKAPLLIRSIARFVSPALAQIALVFSRRKSAEHIVVRADYLGLPLALILKLSRSKARVVLISAWLSRPKKAAFLKYLRVHTHLAAIINYSSVQRTIAAERLGVPERKLHVALQPVDLQFWNSTAAPSSDAAIICSVGLEQRDYGTLLSAVSGLGATVKLAVGTTVWDATFTGSHAERVRESGLPSNVELLQQLSHKELRTLYEQSSVVVVPLLDVETDCGVTVLAEAMAMGRPVIVTRSRGQVDLVVDGDNGIYVPPGDPLALRSAIARLLGNRQEAEDLGSSGRRFAHGHLSIEKWVDQVVTIVRASQSENAG